MQYFANGKAGTAPQAGDVLSYSSVHTSVVTSSQVDGSGNGSLAVIQENASTNGSGTLSVTNWKVSGSVTGWLHNPASDEVAPERTVAGDFNKDGYADVVAFYDYGGGRTGAFIFRGNPNGVNPPVMIWDSGSGNWEWSRM